MKLLTRRSATGAMLALLTLMPGCGSKPEAAVSTPEPPPASTAAELRSQVDSMIQSKNAAAAGSFGTTLLESVNALSEANPGKDAAMNKLRSLATQLGKVEDQERLAVLRQIKAELGPLK